MTEDSTSQESQPSAGGIPGTGAAVVEAAKVGVGKTSLEDRLQEGAVEEESKVEGGASEERPKVEVSGPPAEEGPKEEPLASPPGEESKKEELHEGPNDEPVASPPAEESKKDEFHEVSLQTEVPAAQPGVNGNATAPAANGSSVQQPPATTEAKQKISCVQVLNVMVFFAFMVNYMLRVNLTIAIVDMISLNNTVPVNGTVILDEPKFAWNTYQKNLILGCFFWGYILTELPGGRMSEVFGPRRVFGYSILIASIVTFFTPIAALKFDYMGVVVLRVIIGFMLGVTFPAMQPIASKWIPPKDRTKFVSNMMASSLGAAITLPICGYLISSFGWQSVFYVTGSLGIVWAVAWFLFVFDSPSQHPRITREEREYLEKSIGASSTTRKAPRVPWIQMLTSWPVWAIIVTHASSVFCYFTFLNQMPTYMKVVLQMDIKKNGILSSFPYIGKYVMALITSYIADYIRGKGKLSTTAIRKIFTTFAVGLPGLLMVAQVFLGYSTFWTVSIFTVALTLNGAVTAGYLGNGLDIAPNFSGTIFGMANTLSSMGGFLSTYVVADITYQNETYERFQIVFWILAVVYFFGSVVYLIFGSGKLQVWNNVEEERIKDVEFIEKQPLKNNIISEKL